MNGLDGAGREWWMWSCCDCGWKGWVRAPHGYQQTHRCGEYAYQPRDIEPATPEAI